VFLTHVHQQDHIYAVEGDAPAEALVDSGHDVFILDAILVEEVTLVVLVRCVYLRKLVISLLHSPLNSIRSLSQPSSKWRLIPIHISRPNDKRKLINHSVHLHRFSLAQAIFLGRINALRTPSSTRACGSNRLQKVLSFHVFGGIPELVREPISALVLSQIWVEALQ
jgi:hypothetical protein